jgi:hypothetical protein
MVSSGHDNAGTYCSKVTRHDKWDLHSTQIQNVVVNQQQRTKESREIEPNVIPQAVDRVPGQAHTRTDGAPRPLLLSGP